MQPSERHQLIHQIAERLLEAEKLTHNTDLKFLSYLVQMAIKEAEDCLVSIPEGTVFH